jgi:hypothetical protein
VVGIVSEAIYLHMHAIPDDATGEVRLLALGTSADVSGQRARELAEPKREAVLARALPSPSKGICFRRCWPGARAGVPLRKTTLRRPR